MWTLERRKRASTIVTKSSSEDETSDGSEEKKAFVNQKSRRWRRKRCLNPTMIMVRLADIAL